MDCTAPSGWGALEVVRQRIDLHGLRLRLTPVRHGSVNPDEEGRRTARNGNRALRLRVDADRVRRKREGDREDRLGTNRDVPELLLKEPVRVRGQHERAVKRERQEGDSERKHDNPEPPAQLFAVHGYRRGRTDRGISSWSSFYPR